MALFFSFAISDLFRHARRSRLPRFNGDMGGEKKYPTSPISHTRKGYPFYAQRISTKSFWS
ncbi:hypothetical protein BC826DRAFT_290569 [Russula brevipes]|nr:hypothetical protein BC826DRAFT_290569 [Russula brevipes]